MQIVNNYALSRKNVLGLQQNRNTKYPQLLQVNNYPPVSKSAVLSFSGAKKTKALETFVETVYRNILKESHTKNGPKFVIKVSPFAGGYSPTKGEFTFSRTMLKKKPESIGNIVKHELTHFEQFSLIARLPNGIQRLWDVLIASEKKSTTLEKTLKERNIFDDFLLRNKEKKKALLEQLNEKPDFEKFKTFYEKIVKEKGELTPGSIESFQAVDYLHAVKNYPNVGNLLVSFKDYKNVWVGIKEKAKTLYNYILSPLEQEAYKKGADFETENKIQLKELRRQVIKGQNQG